MVVNLKRGPLASRAMTTFAGVGELDFLDDALSIAAALPLNGFIGSQATSFSGGAMGHRKSKRPDEYVRMTHIQPDVTLPLLRYDIDDAEPGHFPGGPVPILVNPVTGEQETPPRTFYIPNGTALNAIDEEAYVFEHIDTAGVSHLQRVWVPHRHGEVGRWHTVLGAPYNFDVEWLSENAPTAFGQSLNPAQFWQEFLNTAAHNQQNPSQGGPSLSEFQNPPTPTPASELKVPPSLTIHSVSRDNYVEGATIPGHFSDLGKANNSSHNMDATHSAFFWRYIGYEKLELNHAGPLIHRLTHFTYSPVKWDATEFAFPPNPSLLEGFPQRFRAIVSQGPTVQDELGFDQGWYADLIQDSALKNLDDVLTPDTFDTTDNQSWQVLVDQTVYDNKTTPSKSGTGPTLFPSGLGVFVHARSSDGFAIGYAARIFPAGLDKITVLQIINGLSANRVSGVATPHHSHAAGKFMYVIMGLETTRPAGWIGNFAYVYTGPLSLVISELRKIRNQIGTQPDARSIIPWNVRRGTDIQDDQVAVEPPLKPIKVSASNTMRGRLR